MVVVVVVVIMVVVVVVVAAAEVAAAAAAAAAAAVVALAAAAAAAAAAGQWVPLKHEEIARFVYVAQCTPWPDREHKIFAVLSRAHVVVTVVIGIPVVKVAIFRVCGCVDILDETVCRSNGHPE